jgi:TM2 domain-containing membrane protein YozV
MRSSRNYPVAVVLVVFFGFLGAHRFYAGRWITAVIQALTLGGLGLWWIIDIFIVAFGSLQDVERRPIRWA